MRIPLAIFLFIFFILNCLYSIEVQSDARAILLMDYGSERVLYEKNAHTPLYPASTTKVGTAVYFLENHRKLLEKQVQVSDSALTMTTEKIKNEANFSDPPWWLEDDGVIIGLEARQKLPVRDLFYALMVGSANDAANVLAECSEQKIDIFTENMNRYLKTLGCKNTHFANPHGLHHPDHYTTAYDIAVIMKKALSLPELRRCFLTESFFCSHLKDPKKREILQGNELVRTDKPEYYSFSLGGKTGYTGKAKFCLVSAARKSGRTLILALLGCSDKTQRFKDTKEIFEQAFSEKKIHKNFISTYQVFLRTLKGAKQALKASLKNDLSYDYYPSENLKDFRIFIHWKRLKPQIKKGQLVGEVVLEENLQELKRLPLYANEAVEPTLFESIMSWLGEKEDGSNDL